MWVEGVTRPIADREVHNHEIFCKNHYVSNRRTGILMGFMISTVLIPGMNRESHGQNIGSTAFF